MSNAPADGPCPVFGGGHRPVRIAAYDPARSLYTLTCACGLIAQHSPAPVLR